MRRAFGLCLFAVAIAAGCARDEGGADASPASSANARALDDAGRPLDPATGLVLAEGYELVAAHCVACHSTQQFLRQRGTRATWQGIIDWMQATQGLWEFPEGVEEKIVSYLSTHYAPEGWSRRAPIPADLMPPDPARMEMRARAETVRAERR